jgi:uncharacterized protein YggE
MMTSASKLGSLIAEAVADAAQRVLSGNWANNDNDDGADDGQAAAKSTAQAQDCAQDDEAQSAPASRRRARRLRAQPRRPSRRRPAATKPRSTAAKPKRTTAAPRRGRRPQAPGRTARRRAAGQQQRLSDRWRKPFAHAIGAAMNSPSPFSVVILAAGQGTRMRSDTHKVLHPIAGKPMLLHLLDTVDALGAEKRVVVVGKGRDQVEAALNGRGVKVAHQAEQKGTAHAVQQAREALAGFDGRS